MKRIFFILFLYIFFSSTYCNSPDNKEVSSNIDSIQDTIIHPVRLQKPLIDGIWAEKENEPALFLISDHKLYYHEQLDDPIPISFVEDEFTIMVKPIVKCKVLKLDIDSLWFVSEGIDDTTKLYRRK
jgi:hypothetical protein